MHPSSISSTTGSPSPRPAPAGSSGPRPDVASSTPAALELQVVIHIPDPAPLLPLHPGGPSMPLPKDLGLIVLRYLAVYDGDLGRLEQLLAPWPALAQAVRDYRGALLYESAPMRALARHLHSTVQIEEAWERSRAISREASLVYARYLQAKDELFAQLDLYDDSVASEKRIQDLQQLKDELLLEYQTIRDNNKARYVDQNLKGFLREDSAASADERLQAQKAILELVKARADGVTDEQWALFMLIDAMEERCAGQASRGCSVEVRPPADPTPAALSQVFADAFNVDPGTAPLPTVFEKPHFDAAGLQDLKKVMAQQVSFGLAHWYVMRWRAYTYATKPGEASAIARMASCAAGALN
jgi:hypothetical protein